MTRYFKTTTTILLLTTVTATFPACPPQGSGLLNSTVDIKDYWPMQVGNYWLFYHRTKELDQFSYLVEEDYSANGISAWKVRYEYEVEGEVTEEYSFFLIFREDYLWISYNRQVTLNIVNNPDIPLSPGNFLKIVAPRYIPRGANLAEFMTNEIGEKVFTTTGRAQNYVGDILCPSVGYTPNVVTYVVPETIPVAAIHEEEFCGAAKSILAKTVLAQGFGPIHDDGARLVNAIVDSIEYVIPND